ncbi:hypothetical protein ACCO45_013917 [Purpureocillium lilacinum]|uniref:Uncharacterized protein n=1 Tax=Purpureocillium lilacinum TaxID=33203 RepID=A0ACC4D7A1_PURLI
MMCILPVDSISWGARHAKDMEAILDALIRGGARVDEGLHEGRTMMHYINDRVLDNLSCAGLGIARDHLDMADTWTPTKAYFKKLLNIGAHVSASEADEAFRHWLARPALRSLYSNIVDHCKGSLSQPVIDEAFTRSIEDIDLKLWKAICEHLGPRPTHLNSSRRPLIGLSTPFGSKSATRCASMGSTGGYSRTRLALEEAHIFVEKGVKISVLDANGKMAVQYLRKEGLDFSTELRAYLMDERNRELNLF